MDSKIKIHKFYQIHLLHTILFLSISRFCVGNDLIVLGNRNSLLNVFWYFLVADTELYIRGFVRPSICPSVCPSIHLSIHWSVRRGDQVDKWKNERFGYFLCMFVYGVGFWVWMGAGCPCPSVRNDIVTSLHLFSKASVLSIGSIHVKEQDNEVSFLKTI